jgi:hypothetical protein
MISKAAQPFGTGPSGTEEPISQGNMASLGSNIWSGSGMDFKSELFWHFPVPATGGDVLPAFGGETGAWARTLVAANTVYKREFFMIERTRIVFGEMKIVFEYSAPILVRCSNRGPFEQ